MSTENSPTDITVNIDGLWFLQALLGIDQLAPELRGHPCGQPRSLEWVGAHPGLGVLVEQGICDEAAVVRADIAERMRVLAHPDVEVVVLISRGPMNWAPTVMLEDPSTWRAIPEEQLRIVLSRRGGRWASAVRAGGHITIDDCAPVDEASSSAISKHAALRAVGLRGAALGRAGARPQRACGGGVRLCAGLCG